VASFSKIPRLSILVAVFNSADYLPQLCGSIIEQGFHDYEVICINDGSTDNSLAVLNEYSHNNQQFSIYSQVNKGPGYTKDRALSLARGKYVLFLDSDDFIEPDTLETVIGHAEHTDAQIVGFPYDIFTNEVSGYTLVPDTVNARFLPSSSVFSANSIPQTIFQVLTPEVANKLWLRSFLISNGIHFGDLQYAEDYYVSYWSLAIADRITTVHDKAYYHYRKGHTGALTSENLNPLSFITAYCALKEKLIELGLFERLRRSYLNRTMSGLVYEYNRHTSEAIQQMIAEYLRSCGLRKLGFGNEPPSYFYDKNEYKVLHNICSPPGFFISFLKKVFR
jgi:glycosyltransferase involved in cell wall biosynthesis